MYIYPFILFLSLFIACRLSSEKKNDTMAEGIIVEELQPFTTEIDNPNIHYGDTFKITVIGRKYLYDSIEVYSSIGHTQKTEIDSVFIISVPTQSISFLPNETIHEERLLIGAIVIRKGGKLKKSYPHSVRFQVIK